MGGTIANAFGKIITAFLALSIIVGLTTSASANAKYAAIVIDGNTGKVLHSYKPDAARFPASLTKIMTLYILFDYLKKGRLTTNTKFYVTPNAASRPPSKLGLKAGSHIEIKNIIGALVTKSANDVATTVAENIAGSETKFARMMTKKARSLGMYSTTFKNASGLPHRHQKTTARDMAKLSMRMMNDFPRHAKAFKTRRFKYGRRAYRNHNGLLYSYKGTEGIKTGYTRASGFNLTSSVKRGNKHLIAVVMGGRSSRSRNAEMRRLLNKNFPRASASKRKKPLSQRIALMDPKRASRSIRYTATTTSLNWKNRQAKRYIVQKPIVTRKSYGLGKYTSRRSESGYDIQIGAYPDRDLAAGKLSRTEIKAKSILEGHRPYIMQYEKNGTNYHRARFANFGSRTSASVACKHLKSKLNITCIVMLP
ncbi:MAG: D-alanyl-D-alanine carboxypeptidase [bacterium]|nr:D-alanyl-D-alanine carboxypeptidase [bacterium]